MRRFLIAICVFLMMILTSCDNIYEETFISDIQSYNEMWSLSERRAAELSLLFPTVVSKDECIKFNCKHTTYQMVGTGWQVELVVKYEESSFLIENDRLDELCKNSVVRGDSKYFENYVYASVWNWNGCFEYAIVDKENNTVSYIYLQLTDKSELTIDERYIPRSYEMQMSGSPQFSIYTATQDD